MTGVEWVIDARGCDAARLTDKSILAELFDGIIRDLSDEGRAVFGAPSRVAFANAGPRRGWLYVADSSQDKIVPLIIPRIAPNLAQSRPLARPARRVGG